MSFHNKAIILTGACTALGQAVSKQLSKLGTKLVLVDRDQDALATLQQDITQLGNSVHIIANDFQSENAPLSIISDAIASVGQIDFLINIVGDLNINAFQARPASHLAQQTYTELILPMMMSHAVIPTFVQQQSGRIVNVSNIYGVLGLPETACKSATTQALAGFSQALHREFKQQGIHVTFIAAQPIKTEFVNEQISQNIQTKKITVEPPMKVANRVIDAIHQGNTVHHLGRQASWLAWLNRISPSMAERLIYKRYLN